ncbi:lysophospholipase-like protein 1 [Asterias rubens]|uniref:lysophospholipase-like protein 1 n=1 Tax=Asterias rubens TaxID=7604 RepID=UPI001455ABFE|nr:lysophospholipase-like protein 1 [Asterias rubens]
MATGKVASLKTTILAPLKRHTASVIFLHGSGDTADGVLEWIRSLVQDDFQFPHIKVIFPTAPTRPYTPSGGALSSVWYDRTRISPNVPELLKTTDPVCEQLGAIIQNEVDGGIDKQRIVLGGFSMGGGMAMHLAYRFHQDVAGVFALSSFLNDNSVVYNALKSKPSSPPLFACQGLRDQLVLSDWTNETIKQLSDLNVECDCHTFPKLYHELSAPELYMLKDWINKRLPEES